MGRQRLLQGLRRRRRLHDAVVTPRTGILGPRGHDHGERRWLVLQLLRHGLPEARLDRAAGAVLVGLGDVELDPPARQMVGQRPPAGGPPALMPAHRRLARVHLDRLGDGAGLIRELLEREVELARVDALGFLAVQPLTEDVEFAPQRRILTLHERELGSQRGDHRLRGREVGDGRVSHARSICDAPIKYNSSRDALVPPTTSRVREIDTREQQRQIRTGDFHGPVARRRPREGPLLESLVEHPRARPVPREDLNRSPRRLRNRNRWPANGSSPKRSRTRAESPSIERRRSVAPVAT